MSPRVVVDPVTRIEGHLRIEATVEGGKITDAYSSVTMWRGLEKILEHRDPRDAWYFAQRICGVCTTTHATGAVRAVESALGIEIPVNAHLLRSLIQTTQTVHDHVVHFYHLHALDWVDVLSALKADPKKTADLAGGLSEYGNNSVGTFTTVKNRLQTFVDAGQLGPFANGYWGHPAYKLPPEANLMAVSHYLDALEFQRKYVQVHAIIGGKNPHPQTFMVGGMGSPIDPSSDQALNIDRLEAIRGLLQSGIDFVNQVYVPDLLAIAPFYSDWTEIGGGLKNYMSFGDFAINPVDAGKPIVGGLFPAGLVVAGDLSKVASVTPDKIGEDVSHAWYTYGEGDDQSLHPFKGETDPKYTGPNPPYEQLNVDGKYTWLKAPRYDGMAVEVGPLARMVVGYAAGQKQIVDAVDGALKALSAKPAVLFSTVGRTLARALEAQLLANMSMEYLDALIANIRGGDLQIHDQTKWKPSSWPSHAQGIGFVEAPRGTLSHWATIDHGEVSHWQAVVPSTWNGSPRDANGKPGAYESALLGTPVADETQPLEIIRTIHSFDPCMACAAHVLDADGNTVTEVTVS